jgi:ABC-type glycerol-3-phosphate transport system permease component
LSRSERAKRTPAVRTVSIIATTLVSIGLIGWLVVQIYPVVFLFLTSLKDDTQVLNAPFALPHPAIFDNYSRVWSGDRTNQSFLIYLRNSFIVTAGTLALLLAVSSLAGYALARGKFPGRAGTQQIFLLSLAVPVHVLLVPMYFFMGDVGLRNSLLGMILIYATLGMPFTTILMRSYFLSFPRELEDAAMIDGCSRLGLFVRIVLPVSRNALASMAIINIGWVWSELFFALALLNTLHVRTLPIVIASYKRTMMATDSVVGEQFAVMSLTVIPLMIVYFAFQKQIRKGMTAGALK